MEKYRKLYLFKRPCRWTIRAGTKYTGRYTGTALPYACIKKDKKWPEHDWLPCIICIKKSQVQ